MSRPKRWPICAERHRADSLALAREIIGQCLQADRATKAGNRDLALYRISEIRSAAQDIIHELTMAKVGP